MAVFGSALLPALPVALGTPAAPERLSSGALPLSGLEVQLAATKMATVMPHRNAR